MKIASVVCNHPTKIFSTGKEALDEFHSIVDKFRGHKLCPSTFSAMTCDISSFIFTLREQGLIDRDVPNIAVSQDASFYCCEYVVTIYFDGGSPVRWLCEALDYDPNLSNAEKFILNIDE